MQMYKAEAFFSLCPSQHETIYSISQICILSQFFFWYFDTRLWQTQLKFQHINHTPPHPINTDLITQLLLSQELLELCALNLQKFPLSPKPRETDMVMVLVRRAESTSSKEEQALRALNYIFVLLH